MLNNEKNARQVDIVSRDHIEHFHFRAMLINEAPHCLTLQSAYPIESGNIIYLDKSRYIVAKVRVIESENEKTYQCDIR